MRLASSGFSPQSEEGEKRVLNSELWHACAGPLVSLPAVGSRVVYFPQGHSEQVAASTNKDIDAPIPNYPSLPPQLICLLHNVTMHADVETDEVYAQMTLQPLNPQEQKEPYLPIEMGHLSKQPTNYFCKTLTASDTSTHGGFSVPRRAAEKVFPPLDYSLQPPAQELIARDLHDNEWKFRHIFRGQPKRHLLTTGWSVFVSAKRLVAGDSVLFIWNEKNELLLGVRHANRSQTVMPSSVLSSDSMHLGLLAAAAHAAATNSRFTIFYNPRACPSEFVIPMSKYVKAVYHTRVSVGMRFRMLFETEESSVRRYMGTITGISDLDANLWPNSHWRSVKVGWDESTSGERQPRVSLWEIEPLTTFPMYPSPFPLRLKRPWPPGLPHFQGVKEGDLGMMSSSPLTWLRGDPSVNFQGMGMTPWQQPRLDASSSSSMFGLQPDMYQAMAAAALQPMEPPKQPPMQQFQNMSQPQILTQLQQPPHQQASVSSMPMQQPPHQQGFSDSSNPLQTLLGSFPSQDDPGNLFRTGPTWPSKRPAIEPSSTMQNSVSLPPFPDGSGDPHSHLLFGVNIDHHHHHHHHSSSLMMPNGVLPGFRTVVGNGDSTTLPPFTCNYMDPTSQTSDFSLNHHAASMAPSSSDCMDDSGFLQNAEGLENHSAGNFVKVYKSGTFGRSLDITKFSSYNELRSELARMFGLEGLLEDPLRSGWQLVFVDRENDVLLLGDGPWPEFVSSVWCIKILSPQEVHQMDKSGLELLNGSVSRLTNGSCDDFTGRQDSSRSLSTGIPSVGSLDY